MAGEKVRSDQPSKTATDGHKQLVARAKATIQAVFGDTTVTQEVTAASLRDIQDSIGEMLDTL